MTDGKILTEKLIEYAKFFLHLDPTDEIYTRNLLLRELHLASPYSGKLDLSGIKELDVPDTLSAELGAYALENNLCRDGEEGLFSAHILGLLTPAPSVINAEFNRLRSAEGERAACDYLYGISVKNNYIQKTAISRNLWWQFKDGEKTLEVTINLSKPEKDNKDIAKLLTKKPTDGEKYPACLLCKENVGYGGTLTHPARSNIRTVNLTLGGKSWFVQYSPYAYYNEHCIAIADDHHPMSIDETTPDKLFDFVDIFPNYFIGSNAALPIVGGSILNHEHFQGGGYILPMQKAEVEIPLYSKDYPTVSGGILDWYNSAMRFKSKDREALSSLTKKIIEEWKKYSNESSGIYAETDGIQHNTLSPIASKDGEYYVMNIILRNNITSEEYPDGVFHAHPEYFNIKKEGIGLIEAMGLFILPGRLKRQTAEIEKILTGEVSLDEKALCEGDDLYVHRDMICALKKEAGGKVDRESARSLVTNYINRVCASILDCTAVFKRNTKEGREGFLDFAKVCGLEVHP